MLIHITTDENGLASGSIEGTVEDLTKAIAFMITTIGEKLGIGADEVLMALTMFLDIPNAFFPQEEGHGS